MAIEAVVGKVLAALPIIQNLSKDRRELADNALRSISHALTETSLYMKRYTEHGTRDEEVEAQLARFWSAAAIPVRHIDKELSLICEYKSEYWLDPNNWDSAKTNELSIELESVRKKYRDNLR